MQKLNRCMDLKGQPSIGTSRQPTTSLIMVIYRHSDVILTVNSVSITSLLREWGVQIG